MINVVHVVKTVTSHTRLLKVLLLLIEIIVSNLFFESLYSNRIVFLYGDSIVC